MWMWFLHRSLSSQSISNIIHSTNAYKCTSGHAVHSNKHWHFYCSSYSTYMVKPMNNNRGENNSWWQYDDVVYYKAVNIDNTPCCDTATDVKTVANLALPCANSHSQHIHSHFWSFYHYTSSYKWYNFILMYTTYCGMWQYLPSQTILGLTLLIVG